MNERIHPSDNHSQTVQPTLPSDSIDLTDDNETEDHPFDPGDSLDDSNSFYDPGDNPVDDHMELKYDADELESETPTGDPPDLTAETEDSYHPSEQPVSREVRALHKLIAPFNPKHVQPSTASNDTPHTRSGRVTRSSQPIISNPNNYYPADMHHALTHLAEEHVNAAIIDSIVNSEPKQYKDAIQSPEAQQWKKAMKEEMDSMERLGVWKIVPRPKGITTLKGRWVYKNKLGDNNQLIRRKARFVAKGFQQVYGRDFFETHSPVAKMKALSLFFHL